MIDSTMRTQAQKNQVFKNTYFQVIQALKDMICKVILAKTRSIAFFFLKKKLSRSSNCVLVAELKKTTVHIKQTQTKGQKQTKNVLF